MSKIKNKLGFTMVELLGAMVIIGILGTIGVVSVTKVLNNAHKKYNESQGKVFTQAGQNYFSDNKRNLPTVVGEKKTITLNTLVSGNYIDTVYGYNKKAFNLNSSFVTVTKLGDGKYKYEYNLCYDEAGKDCVVTDFKKPNQTTNNSTIQFAYSNYTVSENNILYTNNKVLTTITITKGSKNITGYKYEVIKKSNKKQVKTSEIINVGSTETLSKIISLSEKDYKDDQYLIRVTSYDTEGAAKSVESDKIIFVDTKTPTCNLSAPGANENGWYKSSPTISLTKNDEGSGFGTYGLTTSTSVTYNLSTSKVQTEDTSGTNWYGYVKDKAGNEGKCSILIKMDKTPPTCALETTTGANGNGWWKSDTTIRWNNKNGTGSAIKDYGLSTSTTTPTFNKSDSNSQTTETNGTYWHGYVKDEADNIGHCQVYIKLDKTNPTCALETTTGANENGWWNSPTTIRWNNKTDSLSGVETYGIDTSSTASYNGKDSDNQNNETKGTVWYGHVKDKAGREGICQTSSIKIDTTPPTCTSSGGSSSWTKESRTLIGICTDGTSTCQGNASWKIDWEGAWSELSPGRVYDYAGNYTDCPANQSVYIDKTNPTCSLTIESGTSGDNGWYRSNVKIKINSKSDSASGIAGYGIDKDTGSWPSATYNSESSVTITGDGDDKRAKAFVKDKAGNTGSCTKIVKKDTVAPSISWCKRHPDSGTVNCGTGAYSRIVVPQVSDSTSGYVKGSFTWKKQGATSNSGSGGYNGSAVSYHKECIGNSSIGAFSDWSITYSVKDAAGNPSSGTESSVDNFGTCSSSLYD